MMKKNYFSYICIALLLILAAVVFGPSAFDYCKNWMTNKITGKIENFKTTLFYDSGDSITVETDTVEVLSVTEKSDLLVCSQEMEDYAVEKQEGQNYKHVGPIKVPIPFSSKEYKMILIVRENCYYRLPLSDVRYVVSYDEKTIYVMMPDIKDEYKFKEQKELVDDDDFWRNFSRNNLRYSAKKKIEARFTSEENRALARERASVILTDLVHQLVNDEYDVKIVNRIEQVRK